MPMHFVTDTYEDIDRNCTNPVHRAYCRVKMFRDKVIYLCMTYTGINTGLSITVFMREKSGIFQYCSNILHVHLGMGIPVLPTL